MAPPAWGEDRSIMEGTGGLLNLVVSRLCCCCGGPSLSRGGLSCLLPPEYPRVPCMWKRQHTHTNKHTQTHTQTNTHTHTHLFLHITEFVSKVTWVPWSSGTHSLMSGVSEYSIVNLKRKARDPHMHTLIDFLLSPHPSPPRLLSDLLQNAVLPAVQYKTPFPHGRVSKFTTLWLKQLGVFRTPPHPPAFPIPFGQFQDVSTLDRFCLFVPKREKYTPRFVGYATLSNHAAIFCVVCRTCWCIRANRAEYTHARTFGFVLKKKKDVYTDPCQ